MKKYKTREVTQKPVTFDEALESGKRVRCEHEFITKRDTGTDTDTYMLDEYLKSYRNGAFLLMTNMLFVLSWIVSARNIKEVIKEGKWYLAD